jgi:hypothetical protein
VSEPLEPLSMIETAPPHDESAESRWLAWTRSLFAVAIVVVLVVLGVANIATYSAWHEVEDGVLWASRPEGLTAAEVAPGSAAALAGIARGDVLVAVNGSPVSRPADVVEFQHRSHEGTRLRYTLVRLGTQQGLRSRSRRRRAAARCISCSRQSDCSR